MSLALSQFQYHPDFFQINKAEQQLKQGKTAGSTPAREWFQSRKERKNEQDKLRLDSYNGKKKKLSKEEREKIEKTKANPKTVRACVLSVQSNYRLLFIAG